MLSKNGEKLLKWLYKCPQDWFHIWQLQKHVGDFVDDTLLDELVENRYLSRTVLDEDLVYYQTEYEPMPYSYRISDQGRAYKESLPGAAYDR